MPELFTDFYSTTITAAVATTSRPTTMTVAATNADLPTGDFAGILEPGTANAERVMVTGVAGSVYTFTNEAGSTPHTHASASVFLHALTARSFKRPLSDHVAAADPHTGYIRKSVLTAIGDLIVGISGGLTRLARGADGFGLVADSAQTAGLKYVPAYVQSATAQVLTSGGTITTAGVTDARVAPAAAVTGVILQAGTFGSQKIWVLNESAAAFTVTFATAATSNVADGTASVVPGLTAQLYTWDAATGRWLHPPSGVGSVTSVAITVPAELTSSGGPITTAGTLAIGKGTVAANSVLAGPASGAAAAWAARPLSSADMPVMLPSGGTHASGAAPDPGSSAGTAKFLREDATWQVPAGGGSGGGSSSGAGGSGALVPIMVVGPLTAAQPTLPFSSIPQTGFRNLRLVVVARGDNGSNSITMGLRFNGDTGANYNSQYVAGNTTAVGAGQSTGQTSLNFATATAGTGLASAFGTAEVFIPLYSDATHFKTIRAQSGAITSTSATGLELIERTGYWASTVTITDLTVVTSAGNFDVGSYACLYGEMDTAGVLLTPASNLLYEHTVPTGGEATVDTGTLSQAYRDMRVVLDARGEANSLSLDLSVRFNGDGAANYDYLFNSSGTPANLAGQTSIICARVAGNTAPASTFTPVSFYIPEYAGALAHKNFVAQAAVKVGNTNTSMGYDPTGGFWRSSAPITSIQFSLSSGDLAAGTVIRVYGEPVSAGGTAVGTGTRVRLAANQSIATATATALGWGATDSDADNQHYESAANLTGTVSKTAASATLVGAGTAFTTELSIGQVISVPGTAAEKRVVIAIDSPTSLRVNTAFVNGAATQTATRVNSAIVFRQPGFYTLEVGVYSAALSTGAVTLAFYLNSLTTPTSGTAIGQRDPSAINAAAGYDLIVQRPFQQWDFVEVVWTQNSGGSVNVTADERTHFSVGARPTVIVAVPYINIQDVKAQNTAGGNFTSGADQTRALNTIASDTAGIATLASNQITLPAGTYSFAIRCPCYQVSRHQAFLYNVTDTVEVRRGSSGFAAAGAGLDYSVITGKMNIQAAKTFEVRHRCAVTTNVNGFGVEANFGAEIYTVVELWKEG